jgi:hypothetical protein
MYNTRQYIIFPTTELSKVDFTQVLETSEKTVRKSVDNSKTFVKWSDEQHLFISNLVGSEGPYTHEEIIEILSTEEWTPSIEEII